MRSTTGSRCSRGGKDWWTSPALVLAPEATDMIAMALYQARFRTGATPGHVVAALPFGFWVSLLSSGGGATYETRLWRPALHRAFPHYRGPRRSVHQRLVTMRLLRKRIAHHEPIHYRHLAADHATMLDDRSAGCRRTSPAWVDGSQPGAGTPRDQACDMITAPAPDAGQDGRYHRIPGRARHHGRGPASRPTRCGGRRRSGRWRTSRSPGSGWSPRTSARWPGSRRAAAQVNAELGVLDADDRRGDPSRPPRGRRRRATTTSSRSTCSRPAPAPRPT